MHLQPHTELALLIEDDTTNHYTEAPKVYKYTLINLIANTLIKIVYLRPTNIYSNSLKLYRKSHYIKVSTFTKQNRITEH